MRGETAVGLPTGKGPLVVGEDPAVGTPAMALRPDVGLSTGAALVLAAARRATGGERLTVRGTGRRVGHQGNRFTKRSWLLTWDFIYYDGSSRPHLNTSSDSVNVTFFCPVCDRERTSTKTILFGGNSRNQHASMLLHRR